jgi:hypothetical protein
MVSVEVESGKNAAAVARRTRGSAHALMLDLAWIAHPAPVQNVWAVICSYSQDIAF